MLSWTRTSEKLPRIVRMWGHYSFILRDNAGLCSPLRRNSGLFEGGVGVRPSILFCDNAPFNVPDLNSRVPPSPIQQVTHWVTRPARDDNGVFVRRLSSGYAVWCGGIRWPEVDTRDLCACAHWCTCKCEHTCESLDICLLRSFTAAAHRCFPAFVRLSLRSKAFRIVPYAV